MHDRLSITSGRSKKLRQMAFLAVKRIGSADLSCVNVNVVREKARSMPSAPDIDPQYWHQRAEEARHLAARMTDETAKQTMLMVAEDCDSFAVAAIMRYFEKLFGD